MAAGLTSYDAVYYPGYPLRQTHPGHLAAIAALHGLEPASPSRCRVLEFGAGDGGNLIPLAYTFPGSHFLGIDLAPTPVERGRRTIAELALKNIDLRCGDVMDLSADAGSFDYIIAHGFYSWVPAPVRDRAMALVRELLAPHGVAYVSYNVYPGCHVRQMVRGMMLYHTRAIDDPRRRIDQARAVVKFLSDGQTAPGAFGEMLREELRRSAYVEDEALLYHDDLADVSDPAWFHEFVDHARSHGLRFLAESDYHTSDIQHLPDATRGTLESLRQSDRDEFEQYLDFLKCRRFRQSLLCRAEAPVQPDADASRVSSMAASCGAKVDGSRDLAPDAVVTFREPRGDGTMSIDLPVGKAALFHLTENYPASVTFPALVAAASARLGHEVSVPDQQALAEVLLAAFAVGMVELKMDPPAVARMPGPRPTASALARSQLRSGSTRPTNLRHERVKLDHTLTRQLVLLLDGSRNRDGLLAELTQWAVANSKAPADPDRMHAHLAEQLDEEIRRVAELALLHE